jgi:alcohol oxidase
LSHFQPNAFNKFYVSSSSQSLNGREAPVWVGKTLGGGTSINTMMYTRPPATDFDDWQTPGWTGDDVIPYFKKV